MNDETYLPNLMKANEALFLIQKTLNAPKSQWNSFGKYHYRNVEDILEALKKIMPEGAVVILEDELRMIGDRFYVEATASFNYLGITIRAKAFAREALEKKGMDACQVTGSTSSYARKYALNGLFCIDDNKDNDTNEHAIESNAKASKPGFQKKAIPMQAVNQQKIAKALEPTLSQDILSDLARQLIELHANEAVMEAAELVAELTAPDKKAVCKHLSANVITWLKALSNNPLPKENAT